MRYSTNKCLRCSYKVCRCLSDAENYDNIQNANARIKELETKIKRQSTIINIYQRVIKSLKGMIYRG